MQTRKSVKTDEKDIIVNTDIAVKVKQLCPKSG